MDLYTFIVEKFLILDTRAKHQDTLWLGYSAFVDGDMVAQRSFRMGDFNNGDYSTANYDPSYPSSPGLTRVVINDPTSKVAFLFQLLNSDNVPNDIVNGRITATADQLAGITAGLAGAGVNATEDASAIAQIIGSGTFWAALAIEAFATFYSWLTADCDGPVAIDQISGPRYVLDAWTDTSTRSVNFARNYPGSPQPGDCHTSNYEVTWWLRRSRAWMKVLDAPVDLVNPPTGRFVSETGVSAAAHNGTVHAFGVGVGSPFPVTHARTFTGASWTIDLVGKFDLAPTGPQESVASLPVSAVSYDDRLYVFGILKDHSIQTLAYTVDGGSWVQQATGPGGLLTAEPIATAAFRHRLYLLARDSGTNHLRMTSTADLETFNPWVDVLEPAGFPPVSSVAAAALGESLHIFGVYQNTKDQNHGTIIMHKSTADGNTWTGWDIVEGGAHPEGAEAQPQDVSAGIFRDRIYLATRWKPTNHIALNFSEDGANWSGWRIPQFDIDTAFDPTDLQFGATAALAPVGNHLYIFAPTLDENQDFQHVVWVY